MLREIRITLDEETNSFGINATEGTNKTTLLGMLDLARYAFMQAWIKEGESRIIKPTLTLIDPKGPPPQA
jgi:hypothetical protein